MGGVSSLCVCVAVVFFLTRSLETFPRTTRAEKDKLNNINPPQLMSGEADTLLFFPSPLL